jgi:hypothetical protein
MYAYLNTIVTAMQVLEDHVQLKSHCNHLQQAVVL